MNKRLVITEKPSVARDIVGALGGFSEHDGYWESDAFLVTFAVGHLFELLSPEDIDPKYKRWTLDTLPILPERFELKAKAQTKERVGVLRRLLKREDVGGVVNACDAGREGELIFREIMEFFHAGQPIERLWLQSMTRDAIRKGFSSLMDGRRFEGLSDAAHCRNYSDWLIGMNATRALTRRLKSKTDNQAWSAGRVQTPTLAMMVDRELEILEHVPAPYWRVHAEFEHESGRYRSTWFDPAFKSDGEEGEEGARDDRIFDEAKARAILAKVEGRSGTARETRKPSSEAAPPLFDLTSLQREANRRFGWSARRTLNAAQRCYEAHKVLTYPRTDTKALPSDYRPVVDEVVEQLTTDARFASACRTLQAKGRLNEAKIFDDAKVTDHFAIVPTGTLVPLSGDDERLFDLVTRRFLAAFFPPAVWSRVERITEVEGESFRSRARTLQVPGWREVLKDEGTEAAERLPPLIDGQDVASGVSVLAASSEVEADETKPPPRISEARLLSLMENAGRYVEDDEAAEAMRDSGIGTPATRADIIENLITKGYVARLGRGLKPSVKGIRLIDILRRIKAERLASPTLTGEIEAHLARVEKGGSTRDSFMEGIYEYAREIVELTKTFEFESLYPNQNPVGICPCEKKRPVYERAWFYRCEEPEGVDWQTIKEKKKKGEAVPEDCAFRIWKDKSGRYLDRKTVTETLEHGASRTLDGFLQRDGKTYKGVLSLTREGLELKRLEGTSGGDAESETPEYEVDETPLVACPACQDGQIVETRATFICSTGLSALRAIGRDDATLAALRPKEIPEGQAYCSALLPRTICKRPITREEALAFFRDKKTPALEEFTSRKGRPFSAQLFVKEDTWRHGFDFGGDADKPKRGRAAGAEGASSPASKKRASKKSATEKKSPAKKTPSKKASSAKKVSTKKNAASSEKAGASKQGGSPNEQGASAERKPKKPVLRRPAPSGQDPA